MTVRRLPFRPARLATLAAGLLAGVVLAAIIVAVVTTLLLVVAVVAYIAVFHGG